MKKILLVEDDPFLIDIYTRKLKKAGFETVVAEEGKKALKLLQQKTFELVILDIVLPEVDGWAILKEIKELKQKNRDLENLKIIILSNLGQKEEVEKGLKLGATKYLIKAHFTPSQVVEEIKKIL
ncbi:MAG: response regulator [Candidatus Nealsonbacteria bacterium]|mgnify:FL=1|nr:MAG: response regulator [Candidatus Nealsonbacteria bacterium]